MTFARQPRSVRNNNPGNIEANSVPWVGLASPQEMTSEQRAETRFCVFRTPAYGFRALAMLLTGYAHKYGLVTVSQIIKRFAPPGENATGAYVKAVSLAIGKEPDAVLDMQDREILTAFCRAIATHEAGGWFFDAKDLESGIDMVLGKSAPTLIS